MPADPPLNRPKDWWKVYRIRLYEGQLVQSDLEGVPPRIVATARAWQAATAQEPDPGTFVELQIGEITQYRPDGLT